MVGTFEPKMAGEDASALAKRLSAIRARVDEAARAAGREPGSVRLLAVSKAQPEAAIRAAYEAGQREFGENYAQELERKAEALSDLPDLVFHFVGRLQRNKAKTVARRARLVHAVDRPELAEALALRVPEEERLGVLCEVNLAGEPGKGGCAPEALGALLEAIERQPRLVCRGLMTIPPAEGDPRPLFARLRELRDASGGERALPELSMGMSGDFEAAIAEGATIVRVGTAIFGARR